MATLTLRNVPDELYQRLKEQAAAHRRSLNQETIAQLASAVSHLRTPAQQAAALAKVDALLDRQRRAGVWIDHDEVKALIEEGRD